jgi:hypothetical protein
MNILDGLELLAALSRRAAVVIAVVLVVGVVWFRAETTNFLYGQALRARVAATNPVTQHWDLHCSVHQNGLTAPAAVRCQPTQGI